MRLSPSKQALLGHLILCAFAIAASSTASAFAAAPGTATEYSASLPGGSDPTRITPGPEGNLWFTDESNPAAIGLITPSGAISEFSTGLPAGSQPYGITTGPEGDLWFTDRGHASAIGRLAPDGDAITEFSVGLPAESFLWSNIIPGPNGDFWFVDWQSAIGYVTPSGQITEWPDDRYPEAIADGPEGDLWVTLDPGFSTGAIERVTPTGEATFFSAGLNKGAEPTAIALGPDGNLWFVNFGTPAAIGRITPSGQITEFSAGLSANSLLYDIVPGPDGDMWFVDDGTRAIGRITMNGEITEFSAGLNQTVPLSGVAPGANGNIWFVGGGGGYSPRIGQIATGAPAALVSPPTLAGAGEPGEAQTCQPAQWSSWAGEQPSTTLWPFDGYKWLLNGTPTAEGQSFTPTTADGGDQIACQETVTYPSPLLVSTVAMSTTSAIKTPVPVLTELRESANHWREGTKLAQISSTRQHPKMSAPTGTVISFSLNEQATLTLSFSQVLTGRRADHGCIPPDHSNRKQKPCERKQPAGKLMLGGRGGRNKIAFQGRLSPMRKLHFGTYIVEIIATNNEGRPSAPHQLRFTILPSRY
jgi:streptogramin lyase